MPITLQAMKYAPPKRKRLGEYRLCPYCNKSFYLTPARANRNEQFCSTACRFASVPKIEKVCPICKKTFRVNASVANRFTACSIECRKSKATYSTCKRCGKVFYNGEKRYSRYHCSESCRRPPMLVACKTCGKQFRRQPQNTDRQFCSFSCYRKSKTETLIEKEVREILTKLHIDFEQEKRIGRYSIDFFIPLCCLAIEVDGEYWHRDPKRDKKKDAFLKSNRVAVLRVSESTIKKGFAEHIIKYSTLYP